ncbi:MAG TPA: hypothetical protein VKY74_07565 [Chloroflexia bacterium]|nr:hypothetical protein [Chloroflexia bacterium]
MHSERVDSWDDEAEAAPPAAPDRRIAPRAAATPPAVVLPAGEPAGAEAAAPRPSWREMTRTAPPWIWLITVLSLGGIFAMCFVVFLLMALLK